MTGVFKRFWNGIPIVRPNPNKLASADNKVTHVLLITFANLEEIKLIEVQMEIIHQHLEIDLTLLITLQLRLSKLISSQPIH